MNDTMNTREITGQKENHKATPLLADAELRDYFAAKAMQAMVASTTYESGGWAQDSIAAQSYSMADAMLKDRWK